MATCKGRKKDGTPCRSLIVLDNGYCRAHQDQAAEAKAPEEHVRWTRERLEAAIAAHGGPEELDLAGANLSNLDLSGMDLHGIVLSRWDEESKTWIPAADLQGAGLKGANLQGAGLARADLQGACLDEANLQRAQLQFADLRATSLQCADLQEAILVGANMQAADLDEANLQRALLWGPNLQGASLRNANLQEACLECANLQEAALVDVDLQGASLRNANLQEASLWGASLQRTELQCANLQEACLDEANLQRAVLWLANLGGARLWRANLQGTSLRFADLREVDLLDVRSLQGVELYRAKLDHTALRREQLGPAIGDEQAGEYREARNAYLALKQNFEDLGDYEAASWSYIKERQMEKACSAPWRARRFYGREQLGDTSQHGLPAHNPRVWWFFMRYTAKWLSDWFVELICGYGESISRVLFWMLASFFGFAAYYWRIGGVWLVEPNGEATVATSFWHYLIYSAGAFTTTEFARFQAADDRVRMITAIQAIIGIILAGLLGFVAGNRIRGS